MKTQYFFVMSFFISVAAILFVAFGISFAQTTSTMEQRISEAQARVVLLERDLANARKELENLLAEKTAKEAEAAAKKQEEELLAKNPFCYEFKSLYFEPGSKDNEGDTVGDEVSKLQKILASDTTLYPEGKVTGVFGQATKQAVGRLQLKLGIFKSSAARNFGILGKQTMAAMKTLCKPQTTSQSESKKTGAEERSTKEQTVSGEKEGLSNKSNEPQPVTQETNQTPAWVKVISPNGKEKWFGRRSYDIIWASSPVERVNIGVVDSEGNVKLIARDLMNEKKFVWVIPPSFTPGEYKIRVAISDPTNLALDESDEAFSIANKHLIVSVPDGGEEWARGEAHDIQWDSSGIARVDVVVLPSDTVVMPPLPPIMIAKGIDNTGLYKWTPSFDFRVANYKIAVIDADEDRGETPTQDQSNSAFAIKRASFPVTLSAAQGAANSISAPVGTKNAELLKFDLKGREDLLLSEISLSVKPSNVLVSAVENLRIRDNLGNEISLVDANRLAADGSRVFKLKTPIAVSLGKSTPLSLRGDLKNDIAKSVKEIVINILNINGEGAVSGDPIQIQGSVDGKILLP